MDGAGEVHEEDLDLDGGEDEQEDDDAPRSRLSVLLWNRRPLEEVRRLFDEHPDVIKKLSRDTYRRLPLHEAIVSGSELDVIRYLLELWPLSVREKVEDSGRIARVVESDITSDDEFSEEGLYPLHLALVQDSARLDYLLNLVKLLVEAWPESLHKHTPRCRLFPLNLAVDATHACPSVVRYLFDKYPQALTGAIKVKHPLHRKLKRPFEGDINEHVEVVKFLVEHIPHAISEWDHFGLLPLHYAAQGKVPVAVTKFLIEQNPAAVREENTDRGGGLIPLQHGVKHGTTVEHVKVLLEAWPESISARDSSEEGYTALHRAVARVDIQWDVLQYLAEASPQAVRCRSAKGLLPLHVAVSAPSLLMAGVDPLKMAQYLVELYPEAVRERDDANGELPLHRAIRTYAHQELVLFLFHRFPESVRETDAEGQLPLHLAAAGSFPSPASQFLYDVYPEAVRTRDARGRLPLHAAVSTTHPHVTFLQSLIQLFPGAVRERDYEGLLPIHHAAVHNELAGPASLLVGLWPESVRELTGWGGTLLACAAAGDDASPEMVLYIAHLWPEAIAVRDHEGWLPLHRAVCRFRAAPGGALPVLLRLWPAALRDRNNARGMLPLHCAAYAGATVIAVRFLVEMWPESVGERCANGWLPLHYAVDRNDPLEDAVHFLVEQRPESVLEALPDGRIALHCAVRHKATRLNLVQYLVNFWPDAVRLKDAGGALPLHYAAMAESRHPDVVKYLLEVWPQAARVRDTNGRLPLHLAATHGARLEVVYVLLSSFPDCLLAGT